MVVVSDDLVLIIHEINVDIILVVIVRSDVINIPVRIVVNEGVVISLNDRYIFTVLKVTSHDTSAFFKL